MWLFFLHQMIITATGAFTTMHLLLTVPGKKTIRYIAFSVLGILSVLLIFMTAYKKIIFQLPSFNNNWIVLAISAVFLWYWNKKRTFDTIWVQFTALSLSAFLFWISWPLINAVAPENTPFLLSGSTGIAASIILILWPAVQKRGKTVGHSLAVIQTALTIYYLIESSWNNSLSSNKPTQINPDAALSFFSGNMIAIGVVVFFSIGILTKLLKK